MNESFWNDRYSHTESSYGNNPNEFFKEHIQEMTPGEILLPGEGEGRNALFAAEQHWNVSAIDFSEAAKEKALTLVRMKKLNITYQIGDLGSMILPTAQYDAIALIYIHLLEKERKHLHLECVKALKPGGKIILEAFSKEQKKYSSGGPKDSAWLYALKDLEADFKTLNFEVHDESTELLNEGVFHHGPASVVRIVAKK